MSIGLGVAAVLTVYVLAMGFLFYFCIIASPETSNTARFVAHTLPNRVLQISSKMIGPKGVKITEMVLERVLAVLYLAIVIGSFSALWWYAYPWVRRSSHVPDYHLMLGYGVVFFALYTWRLAMTTRYENHRNNDRLMQP